MVRRVAPAIERKRDEKAERDRARRAAEAEKRAARKVDALRADAADYYVYLIGVAGTTQCKTEHDSLRAAIRKYREHAREDGLSPVLARLKNGEFSEAVFHGRTFAGWQFPDGRREASS